MVNISKNQVPGSIYLNGGRYWWKVKLPGETKRKDIPLTPYGAEKPTKDRKVAEELARMLWKKAYQKSADQNDTKIDSGIINDGTVASLIEAYKVYARKRYVHQDGSSTGQYEKIAYIMKYFERFSNMNVEDITSQLLEDWLVGLTQKSLSDEKAESSATEKKKKSQKPKKQGLCRKLANYFMREVRRMFKWGVKRGRVPEHVYWTLTLVDGLRKGQYGARESEAVTSIDPEIVEKTLPFCPDVVADMLRLQLLTGARPGEVRMMRACDITMRKDIWLYEPKWHKETVADKDRLIPLGPQAQEIIKKYLIDRRTDQYLFSPAEAVAMMRDRRTKNRKAPLNEGNRPGTNRKDNPQRTPGEIYTPTAYDRAVNRAIQKANKALKADQQMPIPHWHPYQIRHTVANLVDREYGEKAAKNFLGHASLETTRRHYLERDLKQAVEVSLRIG